MPTSIRLDPEVEARLDGLAARTGRTKAFYLRELIVNGLDRVEWEYDLAARAEDVRAGRASTVALEDLVSDLGLED